MSDEQVLLDLTDEIQGVTPDIIKPIATPVAIFLHEADSLYTRGSIDLQELVAVGMPANLLDRINHIRCPMKKRPFVSPNLNDSGKLGAPINDSL